MGLLYLLGDKAEIDRRRQLLGTSVPIEAWQDLYAPGVFWMGDDETRRRAYGRAPEQARTGSYWLGEDAKRMLDSAGEALGFELAVDGEAVCVYYGPRLADTESLPTEESLKARVLSARGIAVAWVTHDERAGRVEHGPGDPTDAVFYLRRARGTVAHLWRLFRSKTEALSFASARGAHDPEALEWAEQVPVRDFDELIRRFGRRPPVGKP